MKPTAQQLYELIKQRFSQPGWVTFSEVSDGTGANIARYADAIAMAIWPSRGYEVNGFEIKVSRGDWLKELADPSKSHAVQRFCDRWWIVVADAAIVQEGELPKTWGLMAPKPGPKGPKLQVLTKAPLLKTDRMEPAFVASILRRQFQCQQTMIREALEQAIANRVDSRQAARHEENSLRTDVMALEIELRQLKNSVEAFERNSGVKIGEWSGGMLGDAVRRVLEIKKDGHILRDAEILAANAKQLLDAISVRRDKLVEILNPQ